MKIPQPKKASGNSSTNSNTLKPEHLKSGKGTFLASGAAIVKTIYGDKIAVSGSLGKGNFILFVKLDSPNHQLLTERFGDDSDGWQGEVKLEVKEHLGRKYIAVV